MGLLKTISTLLYVTDMKSISLSVGQLLEKFYTITISKSAGEIKLWKKVTLTIFF